MGEILNNLMSIDSKIKMSSREIAELTGKEHNKVLRDIRDLEEVYGKLGESKVGRSFYKSVQEKDLPEYLLTKRQTFDLLTGYSTELRIKVNRRWELLEKQNKLPDFNNPAIAARAWADEYEKRLNAENKVTELKPKAELAEIAIRDESKHYSITDAGKHLGIRQSEIFAILRSRGYLTMKNIPTQKALDNEILSIRTNVRGGKNYPQAIMTMSNIYNFKELKGMVL